MDWSKAKNILILIFIALNIFLFLNMNILNLQGGVAAETIKSTADVLKGRGIPVKCDISRYDNDTHMLIYERIGYDRNKISQKLLGTNKAGSEKIKDSEKLVNGSKSLTFENENSFIYKNVKPEDNINIADRQSTEKYIKGILAGLGLPASDYVTDIYAKDQDDSMRVVLMEKYKNFIIYDNSVEVSVTKKGITYLKSKFKKIKGFASDKKAIIPANLILLRSYNETQNMAIIGVDIGFMGHVMEQDTKESYEKPIWRIRIEDGSERFFNAYNGEEIK